MYNPYLLTIYKKVLHHIFNIYNLFITYIDYLMFIFYLHTYKLHILKVIEVGCIYNEGQSFWRYSTRLSSVAKPKDLRRR